MNIGMTDLQKIRYLATIWSWVPLLTCIAKLVSNLKSITVHLKFDLLEVITKTKFYFMIDLIEPLLNK